MTVVGPRTQAAAANMRRHRQARSWSAARLAEEMTKVGVPFDKTVVANLEHGRRRFVTIDEAYALADLFGVTVDQLTTVAACDTCGGCPPAGYTCNACGAGNGARDA